MCMLYFSDISGVWVENELWGAWVLLDSRKTRDEVPLNGDKHGNAQFGVK